MLEAWSTLAALSRETSRVRLGTLVTGVTYRNPALLAKTATTLDVLSGGRAIFGLGAAWNDVEHAGYGFEFPALRERMDRLDEALTIVRAMFTEDRPSFEGRHYRISEALNVPRPVQPNGPPILVGGGGEQRTLRIAAKHADMTHWFALGLDALRHKTEVLERHCAEIGRDPGTIERTIGAPVIVAADDAEARAFLERMPEDRRPFVKIGTPEPDGRRDAAVRGRRLHRFHVQQLAVSDARADRPRRRAARPDHLTPARAAVSDRRNKWRSEASPSRRGTHRRGRLLTESTTVARTTDRSQSGGRRADAAVTIVEQGPRGGGP